jgi:hypothetical protein
VGNQLNAQNQFGLQFSPAQPSGIPLQNLAGLLGSGQFAQSIPAFSPIPVGQQPTFGRTLGQSLAASAGPGLVEAAKAGAAAAGSSGGAAAGSHPDLKEAITPFDDARALDDIRHIPVYEWQYKGDSERHIGGMTTDMPDTVITGDKTARQAYDMISYLGLLTAAVRALDAQVQALRQEKEQLSCL